MSTWTLRERDGGLGFIGLGSSLVDSFAGGKIEVWVFCFLSDGGGGFRVQEMGFGVILTCSIMGIQFYNKSLTRFGVCVCVCVLRERG